MDIRPITWQGVPKYSFCTIADFCFFVNLGEFYFEMLESALKEKSIDVVGVPFYPNGVTYGTAGRASGRKVYIRYKDIEQVNEIYEALFGNDD